MKVLCTSTNKGTMGYFIGQKPHTFEEIQDWIFRVGKNQYRATQEKFRKGNRVLDLRDLTTGYHDGTFGDTIAIRDGGCVEVGVPKKYVVRLKQTWA